MAASMAIMAMTTKSSIKVNPIGILHSLARRFGGAANAARCRVGFDITDIPFPDGCQCAIPMPPDASLKPVKHEIGIGGVAVEGVAPNAGWLVDRLLLLHPLGVAVQEKHVDAAQVARVEGI